jgi:hypothetical protein
MYIRETIILVCMAKAYLFGPNIIHTIMNDGVRGMHKNKQMQAVRIATYAMFALGIALIALSAFYVSSFLVILGLAVVFWGGVFLYITPVLHVPLDLLEASANVSENNIERVLGELDLSEKGVYLPPKNLKNSESSLIFIPIPPHVTELLTRQETNPHPEASNAYAPPFELIPKPTPESTPQTPITEPNPEGPQPNLIAPESASQALNFIPQESKVEEAEVFKPEKVPEVAVASIPVSVPEAVKTVVAEVTTVRSVFEASRVVLTKPAEAELVIENRKLDNVVGQVRPPSKRYGPSDKTFNEKWFASVFDEGENTPEHSIIGKPVRTKIESDVGCVLQRRKTPLGIMVLVEFKWETPEEQKAHHDMTGETVWFWDDEVESVEPKPTEDLAKLVEDALDELDSDGAAALKELEEL